MPLARYSAVGARIAQRTAPGHARAAGLPVETSLPDLDERAVKQPQGRSAAAAVLLARERRGGCAAPAWPPGGRRRPTLALGDGGSTSRAIVPPRAQLMALSGHPHLHSAVAVACGEEVLFDAVDTASLTMRGLSDDFLGAYLDASGASVLESVGSYQLEKLGIHLFERIEGDHFTILGLPLFKLIAFLRQHGSLAG
jgi:septum formation protein